MIKNYFYLLIKDSPETPHKTKIFDFLFLLPLRHTNKTSSLVDLVKKQHSYLKRVPDEKIKAVIEGKTGHKIALLLDEYDEYKKGANKEIDRLIEVPDINTFVILTSRPGYVGKELKNEMDGEIVIEGFAEENIERCSEKEILG